MKKLTLGSFTRKGEEGSFNHFFSYKNDKHEICLESCVGGYDVAIYDLEQNLLKPKECTNINMSEGIVFAGFSMMTGEAIDKAIKIANKMLGEKS